MLKFINYAPLGHAFERLNLEDVLGVLRHGCGSGRGSIPTPEEEANVILQAAWLDLQLSYDPSAMDVDVDLECLGILEQRMFELSLAAGAAGNEQWGKDAGTHQDRWNPYEGLPEHWNHGDQDPYAPEFEGELDVHRFKAQTAATAKEVHISYDEGAHTTESPLIELGRSIYGSRGILGKKESEGCVGAGPPLSIWTATRNFQGTSRKKIKITANNGWEHVFARGGIKSRFTKTTTVDASHATEFLKNYRPRARKQSLEVLISLPLDILFEIFGRLLPLDLLHLSRTTKALRSVLMHRSSTTVWMAARSNVKGMPACADDMSEPAHASLAFDMHCHNCLRPNVRNIDWNLRVRYCQKCFKERTEIVDDKFKKTYGLKLHHCLSLSMTQNHRESLVDELSKLGPEERSVLRGLKRDAVLVRKEHAVLCTKWMEGEQQSRWKELDHLRSLRHDAILEKLIELGWEEDVNKLPDRHTARIYKLTHFEDLPLVKQPKPLTDHIWQNIQHKMVEFMGQMREFRILQERKQQIRERQSLLAMIYIRDIVELPAHLTVTAEDFQPVREELFKLVDTWKRCNGHDLRSDLLWRLEIHPPCWLDRLSVQCERLAVAVFTCTGWLCDDIPEPNDLPRYMYFPEYLHHRCNRIRRRAWNELDPANTFAMGQGYPGNTVQREWSMDDLELDKKASQTVRKLAKLGCFANNTTYRVTTAPMNYYIHCDTTIILTQKHVLWVWHGCGMMRQNPKAHQKGNPWKHFILPTDRSKLDLIHVLYQ
ncbi:uncharacterized protein F5891DRAFT_1176386 [Suillus fuscotomentosus]|uniref:F-box domain-containing protein n=1 Tax=Suillus fuscotomentosus TaxID=1912939 RepID=A0AAD4DTE0_9AGAM|nr:uncharacterized protein F5891DRAFT_1176386 [Suillus fuscotomentosus]KAG1893586.1 hypothetical protein F5891DRAFT_1176386 [Suillus fuscotomentosus]